MKSTFSKASLANSNITECAICFSYLRWDFVFQRPNHLIQRLSFSKPVIFWEEPILGGEATALELVEVSPFLTVARVKLPSGADPATVLHEQKKMLDVLLEERRLRPVLLWYYTPMAHAFTAHLRAEMVVYDCMDELSAFAGAPAELQAEEDKLFSRADLVFTGGYSLYEAKRGRHPSVHAFPSSIDAAHFRQARQPLPIPLDQAAIPGPRLGYCGVIDERLDRDLLASLADARPDWQIVMVGPVVKVLPADLPRRANIHYLGMKRYEELPAYLSGWDVALMPFAINEATRFISPTKTPEYLAAGLPVVTTPIADVVRHYGHLAAVLVAYGAKDFIAQAEIALELSHVPEPWLVQVDALLDETSWDRTYADMEALILAGGRR